MKRPSHTTDETGFNFMTNTGQEEHDRDYLGIIFAVLIMVVVTVSQYMGML